MTQKIIYKAPFNTELHIGKGGVGKSTLSAAKAVYYALVDKEKVLVADLDGTQALARAIGLESHSQNIIEKVEGIDNLYFAAIGFPKNDLHPVKARKEKIVQNNYLDIEYEDIVPSVKKEPLELAEYLKQFSGDHGIIPYYDLPNTYHKMINPIEGLHKYMTLIKILQQAKEELFHTIIIDVEPTSGFSKIIESINQASDSMEGLAQGGFVKMLAMQSIFPDIRKYIQGEYVKNIAYYRQRFQEVRQMIMRADYSIVTVATPEELMQMNDIMEILLPINKGRVKNILVNKRGLYTYEKENKVIEAVKPHLTIPASAERKDIPYTSAMLPEDGVVTLSERIKTLLTIGEHAVNKIS